jgi:hypothetical protein
MLRRCAFAPVKVISSVVGAVAGGVFTVVLISSFRPPPDGAVAAASIVGASILGGLGSMWMASGAGAKYLASWGIPTWKPLRWFVQVIGAMGFATIWTLGVFMVVRSLG